MKAWHLYVVRCSDGTLYTGVTTDLDRRLHEHNVTKRGAKYTRTRRPVELVWSKEFKLILSRNTTHRLHPEIKLLTATLDNSNNNFK